MNFPAVVFFVFLTQISAIFGVFDDFQIRKVIMAKEKEKEKERSFAAREESSGGKAGAKGVREAFTETQRIRELVELMAENQLVEIELVERDSRIKLKRSDPNGPAGAAPSPVMPNYAPAPVPVAGAPTSGAPAAAESEKFVTVRSPMVGTFYAAANPESDPYVTIGTQVTDDTVVCIIEAMKVFNEIRAEVSGQVAKILVQSGQAVEFNQPLFLLRP